FSSRRRHTRCLSDWSSDVCSSDLRTAGPTVKVEIGCYDSWPGCPVIWYDRKILMGFYFRGAPSPEWPWVSVKAGSELAIILEDQIGRASCRERVEGSVVGGAGMKR